MIFWQNKPTRAASGITMKQSWNSISGVKPVDSSRLHWAPDAENSRRRSSCDSWQVHIKSLSFVHSQIFVYICDKPKTCNQEKGSSLERSFSLCTFKHVYTINVTPTGLTTGLICAANEICRQHRHRQKNVCTIRTCSLMLHWKWLSSLGKGHPCLINVTKCCSSMSVSAPFWLFKRPFYL